jgi:c-di-GMP-binding flagellar brake protein YcgR
MESPRAEGPLEAMIGDMDQKENKPRIGITHFERRRHPRFAIDLPVEYYRADSIKPQTGRAINVSEGGLLIYFSEKMEIGQQLKVKLFFASGARLNSIECLVEVVWNDLHLGEGWGDYRSGVTFIDITPVDLDRLKKFLRSLAHEY